MNTNFFARHHQRIISIFYVSCDRLKVSICSCIGPLKSGCIMLHICLSASPGSAVHAVPKQILSSTALKLNMVHEREPYTEVMEGKTSVGNALSHHVSSFPQDLHADARPKSNLRGESQDLPRKTIHVQVSANTAFWQTCAHPYSQTALGPCDYGSPSQSTKDKSKVTLPCRVTAMTACIVEWDCQPGLGSCRLPGHGGRGGGHCPGPGNRLCQEPAVQS